MNKHKIISFLDNAILIKIYKNIPYVHPTPWAAMCDRVRRKGKGLLHLSQKTQSKKSLALEGEGWGEGEDIWP